MKTRSKLLIASLFAGLSLGVLSGVKVAVKDNEAIQTHAANYYWREVTSIDQIANGNRALVVSATTYNGYRYWLSSFHNASSSKSEAKTATAVYKLADGCEVIETNAYPTYRYDIDSINTTNKTFKLKDTSETSRYINLFGDTHKSGIGKEYYEVYSSASGTDTAKQKFEFDTNHCLTADGRILCYYGIGGRFIGTYTSNMNAYADFLYCKLYVSTPYNTITLNNNSATTAGTTSVRGAKYHKLADITVPKKTGYTFGGYYTKSDFSGTQVYNTSGTCLVNYDESYTNLYAKWTANTYKVTLNNQSGTGGTTSVTGTYGSAMPKVTIPARTGYTFGGYYTSTGGSGTQYYKADGTSAKNWDKTEATTLYAKWTPNTYTITFNGAGGELGTSSISATYGSAVPSITLPSRSGYSFGGFYTGENGTGTQYYGSTGESVNNWNITSDTTLYAKWTPNTYHVSLDSQGGTGGDTTVDTVFEQAVPAVTIPTKVGYTFQGYYSDLNGTGIQYINGDGSSTGNAWTTASDNTIYGYWTANTYSVKYDGNGATAGSMNNSTHTYGVAKNLTTNAFTKTGYTFEGWATSADGDVVYSNEQSVSNLTSENGAVVTLYAKWAANTVNVDYFDEGGAAFSGEHGSDVMCFFDYDKGLTLDTPTKQYFTFEGYYLNSNCSGSVITRLEAFSYANDVKLYAKWVKTLSNFAREFLDLTGSYCSGDKSFTNTLKDSFNMLSASDKELFIDTEVVEGLGNTYSSDIVEAKSRYYNMVTERGFDQFLEGMNVQPMSKSLFNTTTFFGIEEEDIPEVSTAAVLVVLGGFSVGAYFLLKKKKFN